MALQSRITAQVGAECLGETWQVVGSGGFGQVYKARHKEWKFNVAIKLLHDGVGALEEASIMDLASCEFILRVYGIFEGRPPVEGIFERKGIIMEFMQRGCVQTLQKDLSGPPPWPLAFRLAHEVALGMNFLHSKNLVHSDLKPSNVLLNDDLHAKLADFGLSRVSTSAPNNDGVTREVGGSFKYMPPEAFDDVSYKPVRSFDIYSYGILLWSIVNGEEPYSNVADYHLVALRIPQGDRPLLDEFDCSKSEGLEELVDFMKRCWVGEASKRPDGKECCDVTELVFSKHKTHIKDAVSEVLERLGSSVSSPPTPAERSRSNDIVDNFKPETVQHDVDKSMSDTDKAKFVDDKRATLIQNVSEVMAIVDQLGDMVHSETYSGIESKPKRQDKMRMLFQETFCSGGVKVKAAFYDILKKDFPDLVRSLGGEL